ncbi:MAG: hypothetical protein D6694_09220 [Gammaproteobacteria bacterium]|nr:MAG: hypothetical protein D6694_09220 [Gammaproteobacteria bacterium]
MSERIMLTLPASIAADLKKWARQEGRPTANLAAFLIEQAVRGKFEEKYPPRQ